MEAAEEDLSPVAEYVCTYIYNITELDVQHIELICSKTTLMFKNELNSLADAIIQMQLSECHPMFQISAFVFVMVQEKKNKSSKNKGFLLGVVLAKYAPINKSIHTSCTSLSDTAELHFTVKTLKLFLIDLFV